MSSSTFQSVYFLQIKELLHYDRQLEKALSQKRQLQNICRFRKTDTLKLVEKVFLVVDVIYGLR